MKNIILRCCTPLVLGSLAMASAHAQVTLQASHTQTAGCSFSAVTPGTMTLSSDWKTMSTDSAGGSRPSVLVTNVGPVTLNLSYGGYTWTLNGGATGAAIATNLRIMDSAANGTALAGHYVGQSFSYNTSGSRTLYLSASGTNPSVFYNPGTFKISVPFSCL